MTINSPVRVAFCLLWLFVVGAGFVVLLDYQNAVGSTAPAPEHWPAGTPIALDRERDTLVMFAHPQCPCTRASMEELNRLLARTHEKAAAHVLFFRPGKFPEDWARTDLWRSAAAIPGVAVQDDPDGAQAERFGAKTSGYVLLYDTHGQLLFKGGITGSRGHAGDNAGESTVAALLSGQSVSLKQTKVFGCSLLNKCDVSATLATK